MQRLFNNSATSPLLMLALAVALPIQAAQAPADTEANEATAPLPTLPEEVVITGERSVLSLRLEMEDAEVAAYELFNQFNDEARFMITCSDHQATGTRISRQVCMTAFEREANAAHARMYYESTRAALGQGQGENTIAQPVAAVIASQQEAYRAKMREVAETQPAFLEAIMRYSRLRERYEAATRTAAD